MDHHLPVAPLSPIRRMIRTLSVFSRFSMRGGNSPNAEELVDGQAIQNPELDYRIIEVKIDSLVTYVELWSEPMIRSK